MKFEDLLINSTGTNGEFRGYLSFIAGTKPTTIELTDEECKRIVYESRYTLLSVFQDRARSINYNESFPVYPIIVETVPDTVSDAVSCDDDNVIF